MASWQDGAEYAPLERPDGFATPRTSALSVAEPPVDPAAGQPAQAPDQFESPSSIPLDQLTPRSDEPRNPTLAFDTSGAAMTSGAWGAAHRDGGHNSRPWTPEQPLLTASQRDLQGLAPARTSGLVAGPRAAVAPDPRPIVPGLAAPGARTPRAMPPAVPVQPVPADRSVADLAKQFARDVGWPLLAVLAAGLVLRPFAFVLLVVAALLTGRSRLARHRISRSAWSAVGAAAVLGLLGQFGEGGFDSLNVAARPLCAVLLLAVVGFGYHALTRPRR